MKIQLQALIVAVVASANSVTAADLIVTETNVASFYREFSRLTTEPHLVAPLTGELCRTPPKELLEEERRMTGPHHLWSIHLYANPQALSAVTNRHAVFPVGSVIVKEKLLDDKVSGIGGMIKRAAGYDSPNGDWEYFYYGKPREFSSGRLKNCVDCHRGAKTKDHVYSVWDLPAVTQQRSNSSSSSSNTYAPYSPHKGE